MDAEVLAAAATRIGKIGAEEGAKIKAANLAAVKRISDATDAEVKALRDAGTEVEQVDIKQLSEMAAGVDRTGTVRKFIPRDAGGAGRNGG